VTLKGKTTCWPYSSPHYWRLYPNPKRADHHPIFHHHMPWWHESQCYFILDYDFQESDVSNCARRPTSTRKCLLQMSATSALNLHPGRIMSYYNSLWQWILPPYGPFSSRILCKSARACPGSRAEQPSKMSPCDLSLPTIQSSTLHHGQGLCWWSCQEVEFLPCQEWNLSVLTEISWLRIRLW
jgi:hypothetical protein